MKLNNKGFSLVELIIAIAIIAILSAALVPQWIKYVEKAAIETDKTTCESIKTMVYTLLMSDELHDLYAENGGIPGGHIGLMIIPDRLPKDYPINFLGIYTKSVAIYSDRLADSVRNNIPRIDAPKQAGKNSYVISVEVKREQLYNETTRTYEYTYAVGDIDVYTSTAFTDNEIKTFFKKWGATHFYF